MKFLIGVLFLRFLIEAISKKENKSSVQNNEMNYNNVRHPAEFELR
ncbi:MAG: hypothetical protein AAB221_11660 [Bacteroidota bacterium]